MEDQLDAFERAAQNRLVVQAPAQEIDLAFELFDVFEVPGREVVDDADARTARCGRGRDGRADEARAPCDEHDCGVGHNG